MIIFFSTIHQPSASSDPNLIRDKDFVSGRGRGGANFYEVVCDTEKAAKEKIGKLSQSPYSSSSSSSPSKRGGVSPTINKAKYTFGNSFHLSFFFA
jgi:hypothetical protein